MKPVKMIKRWLLGIFVGTIPVVIAACYGVWYDITGNVVDSRTDEGIEGIEVTCVYVDDRSTEYDESGEVTTYTNANGYYEFASMDYPTCDIMKAKDVDGSENGTYLKKTVYPNYSSSFDGTIEMRKLY